VHDLGAWQLENVTNPSLDNPLVQIAAAFVSDWVIAAPAVYCNGVADMKPSLRGQPGPNFSMWESHVSRSIAISLASDRSGKFCGGSHSLLGGNKLLKI